MRGILSERLAKGRELFLPYMQETVRLLAAHSKVTQKYETPSLRMIKGPRSQNASYQICPSISPVIHRMAEAQHP